MNEISDKMVSAPFSALALVNYTLTIIRGHGRTPKGRGMAYPEGGGSRGCPKRVM